jgi:hypothetical protein
MLSLLVTCLVREKLCRFECLLSLFWRQSWSPEGRGGLLLIRCGIDWSKLLTWSRVNWSQLYLSYGCYGKRIKRDGGFDRSPNPAECYERDWVALAGTAFASPCLRARRGWPPRGQMPRLDGVSILVVKYLKWIQRNRCRPLALMSC